MRAAFHTVTGGTEVLHCGDVDDPPPPAPGDVLIRVRASSIDRVDLYWREGSHGMAIRQQPHIGGRDIAGIVEAVGDGVTRFRPGDEVVATGWRTHAELAVTPERWVFPKPANITFEQAAAIPTAGRSAYQAMIERVHLAEGETVLVTAAGSGVGSFGVQIARASGCDVLATASVRVPQTVDKLARARELGARFAFDSHHEHLTRLILDATGGEGVDVVLDHVGTPLWDTCVAVLKPWGRYVTTGVTAGHRVNLHLGQVFVKGLTITGVGRPSEAEIAHTLRGLLAMVASGAVVPQVSAVFDLSEIRQAHELVESSDFFGKVILRP